MRELLKPFVASLVLVSGLALYMPDADAITQKQQEHACQNSPRCHSHHNKDGTYQGCTGSGNCFYCDGKKCWSTTPARVGGGGSTGPTKPPGGLKSSGTGSTGPTKPPVPPHRRGSQ
jgi:hypothetical protein